MKIPVLRGFPLPSMTNTEQLHRHVPGPDETYSLDANAQTLELIGELIGRYGDIVRVRAKERKDPSYLINDPDCIRQILVTNHTNYIKGIGFERVQMLLGNGIIVSNGNHWRRQRSMLQPAFSRLNVTRLCDEVIEPCNLRLIQRWSRLADTAQNVDITTEMSGYALEVILRAIFSNDLDRIVESQGENPFAFLTKDMTRDLSIAMKFRGLRRLMLEIIHIRRREHYHPFDLLTMMMDARNKASGQAMSDQELLDEIATLIIAGHETSAGTLNWAWYRLSSHPEIKSRLWDEIRNESNDHNNVTDLAARSKYTRRLLQETIRLYPPVWLFTRKALQDDILGGFLIPANADIFISPYWLHRHERYWKDPDRFDPDRFCSDNEPSRRDQAYVPFSAGPRRCIGEFFSFIEMQMHLVQLGKKFNLRFIPDQRVELEPGINLRTRHNLHFQVEHR